MLTRSYATDVINDNVQFKRYFEYKKHGYIDLLQSQINKSKNTVLQNAEFKEEIK